MITSRKIAHHETRLAVALLILLASSLLTLPLILPATAEQSRNSSSNQVEAAFESVPGEILVRFRRPDHSKAQQPNVTSVLAEGHIVPLHLERIGASELVDGLFLARVDGHHTAAAIDALNARSDVAYAEPNYIWRRTSTTPNDPRFLDQWGLT